MSIFGIYDIISKIGCTVCTDFTSIFIISLPEIQQSKQRGEIFMKKKAVVLGLVGAMALGTCTVSAANGTKNISATFRNIKIVVDGKELSTSAEPFIYNGTTYLPIRAVGEAVGKEVTWNGGTNTVYLGEVPASAQKQPADFITICCRRRSKQGGNSGGHFNASIRSDRYCRYSRDIHQYYRRCISG